MGEVQGLMTGLTPSALWAAAGAHERLRLSAAPHIVCDSREDNAKFYAKALKLWGVFRQEAESQLRKAVTDSPPSGQQ